MRVEQCEPLAGGEVLGNEIEKESAFAGAGLADDVKMPAPLLRDEHDKFARGRAGTNAKLLGQGIHGRKGAGVPCAPQLR